MYWTLEVELVFYALCLGLHRTRWLERPAVLAAAALALTGLSRWLRIVERAAHPSSILGGHVLCLGLAVMIWGTLFRTVYDGTGGFRRGVLAHRGFWWIVAVALALPIVLDPKVGWYLLGQWFGRPPSRGAGDVGLRRLGRMDHPALSSLGVVSYSLYLSYLPVLFTLTAIPDASALVRGWWLPCAWYCASASALTVGVAAAIYRWVERPAIALGRRWTGTDLTPLVN